MLAVQQRPDLYHAFVGTGQMVSQRATDRMFWEDTLAGPRPPGSGWLPHPAPERTPTLHRHPALRGRTVPRARLEPVPEWNGDRELPATLFVPENDLMDQVNGLRSFLDTFSVLYPQLQDIDFRRDVPSLAVPVYLVAGVHEARGRAVLAQEWFGMLDAPTKEWIVFAHSGHRPSFEEPAAFAELMTRVRNETTAREPRGSRLPVPGYRPQAVGRTCSR